jgi:hypothetical protein
MEQAIQEVARTTIEKKTGYTIFGCTGCTCCESDNIIDGIYAEEAEALNAAEGHERRRTVASQYSRTGIYSVMKIEYELLPDDRIIIRDRVFESDSFYESGQMANDLRYEGVKIAEAGGFDKDAFR